MRVLRALELLRALYATEGLIRPLRALYGPSGPHKAPQGPIRPLHIEWPYILQGTYKAPIITYILSVHREYSKGLYKACGMALKALEGPSKASLGRKNLYNRLKVAEVWWIGKLGDQTKQNRHKYLEGHPK